MPRSTLKTDSNSGECDSRSSCCMLFKSRFNQSHGRASSAKTSPTVFENLYFRRSPKKLPIPPNGLLLFHQPASHYSRRIYCNNDPLITLRPIKPSALHSLPPTQPKKSHITLSPLPTSTQAHSLISPSPLPHPSTNMASRYSPPSPPPSSSNKRQTTNQHDSLQQIRPLDPPPARPALRPLR